MRRTLLIPAALVLAGLAGLPAAANAEVFWTTFNLAGIAKASFDGSNAVVGGAAAGGSPYSIAAVGGKVYWYSVASGNVYWSDSSLGTVLGSLGTGNPGNNPDGFSGLAADASRVYSTLQRSNSDPSDPGTFTQLLWQQAPGVTLSPASALVAQYNIVYRPAGLALAGGDIYWADPFINFIGRANAIDGSNPVTFVTLGGLGSSPEFVAVRAPYVYWSDPAANRIGRARIDAPNSDVQVDFITGIGDPKGVAVTATHIYWADFAGNRIGRARIDGTDVQPAFIAAPGGPAGVAMLGEDLAVTRSGSGTGSITSSPDGVDCGAWCTGTFDPNATVTLTATPSAGSTFAGWSGDCTGSGPTCVVSMTAARYVTARFDPVIPDTPGPGPGAAGGSRTPGATAPGASTRAPLRASVRCAGATCTTTGTLPKGASSMRQVATSGAGALALARDHAGKTVRGTCRVKKGRTKAAPRTCRCTIRLAKGSWRVTTTASSGGKVVAESTRTITVRGARR